MNPTSLHATACIGCRRRGRKCDRTLPTCLSCERRGVCCEGYVTKWPGVAARGKLAGKSIPVVDSSVAIRNSHFTETKARQSQTKRTALAKSPSCSSFTDEEIDKFVHHYIADLSSIFYLGNSPSENPMFHYVLPLVDSVLPIRFALAGSASCHIAARTSDEALERKSLQLRVHATRLMREIIQSPRKIPDQTILASILMLAQLDMCSGDCVEFETHLKAAVAVIRNPGYAGAPNQHYFEQRLAWLDLMGSTTSERPPNLTSAEIKSIINLSSRDGCRQWSYNVFPCPIDMFEIIMEITFLFKTQNFSSEQVTVQIEDLKGRLLNWKYSTPSGPRKQMIEVWKLGAIAYLNRLFPLNGLERDVVSLSDQALDLAKSIPPASSWSYACLWPIFQIAVNLDDGNSERKDQIRRRLKIALETIGCRHHSNALEALEVLWERRERFDPFTLSIPGHTIMLV